MNQHHICCNYQNGPIGGEGCICVIITKRDFQELRSRIDPHEVEQDRQKALENAVGTFETEAELHRRFDPGTFGAHEVTHLSMVMIENVESYILNHPTVVMNEKLYRKAYEAHQLLYEIYNTIACADPKVELPCPTK